jgi:hypothetical protein
MVNDKLKLDGELDKHIDAFAEKVMDKVDPPQPYSRPKICMTN